MKYFLPERNDFINCFFKKINQTHEVFFKSNRIFLVTLCVVVYAIQLNSVHATTINSIAAGSWGTGSIWSTGSVPGNNDIVNINNPVTLSSNLSPSTGAVYTFNASSSGSGTLNMSAGSILDIRANVTFTGSGFNLNGGIIYVRTGYTLTLPGFNESNTAIFVESGATLVVNGNLLNNHGNIQINGTLTVNGNYDGQASDAGVTGTGNFTTTGYMKGINTSMVFGVIPNCTGPNCDGRTLCTGFTAAVTPASLDACSILASQTFTATVSPAAPTPTYQWLSSSTETGTYADISGQTNATYSVSGVGNSKTFYRVKVTRSCTKYSDPVYANASSSLVLVLGSTSITGTVAVCQNTLQTYSASGATNIIDYVWTVPTGSSIISGQGTSSITVLIGGTSGSVAVTAKTGCYTNNATKSITVTPSLAAPGSITGSTSLCQNTIGNVFSIPAVTGTTGYIWALPSGATITSGSNTNSITVTMGTSSGNVVVTPINACGGSSSSSVLAVTISSAVPSAAGAITGTTPVCSGATGVSYSVTSVSGAVNYTWTVPSGASIASGAGTNAITVDWGSTAGNITVVPKNGCGSSASSLLGVTINTIPTAASVTGSLNVCKEQAAVSYSIPTGTGATSYSATLPSGVTIGSGAGTNSIIVSFAGASVTSGALIINATNACGTRVNSITVNIATGCTETWAGTINTDWNTAGNWSMGFVPSSANTITIPASTPYSPLVSGGSGFVLSITVNSGAVLAMSSTGTLNTAGDVINNGTITMAGTGVLNTLGNITNNGTFTAVAGSTVSFNGSSAQSIIGVPTLYNVTINNTAGGVSLLSPVNLAGTLSLVKGVLTTNSNLTINFGAGGEIGYAGSDAGSLSGTVSGTRFAGARTHYIAAPFSGVTSAQVQATTPLYVNPYWKMYSKDFTNQNWIAVTNTTTAMPLGTGFSLSLPTAAQLILTGTYSHTYSLTGPSYSNAAVDKYILVGNPYPSTLDWNNASGWTKINVANAIYFWDPANNRAASYVGNVGSNGGTSKIPAMQSFLVTTTGGGGSSSVSINNNARLTAQISSFFRVASDDVIRLTLVASDTTKNDEAVIRFNEMATDNFDFDLDAHKILNGGGMPSVYTNSGTEMYSINSYASVDSAQYIPVGAKLPVDGSYKLKIDGNNPNIDYILIDKLLGTKQRIEEDSSYGFTGLRADDANRFELQLRVSAATLPTGVHAANKNSGLGIYSSTKGFVIKTDRYAGEESQIEILDMTGNLIKILSGKNLSSGSTYVPLDMEDGAYLIKVNVEGNTFAGMIVLTK